MSGMVVPAVIAQAGDTAAKRYLEFFTATIRNPNTRAAYARPSASSCTGGESRARAHAIEPLHVATYVEQLGQRRKSR